MTGLQIALFDGLKIAGGGITDRTLMTRKTRALVAYLALRGDSGQSREKLAELLWSNSAEEQARANLRQSLSSLRKALNSDGAAYLTTDSDQISLAGPNIELDVALFEQLVAEATPEALKRAAELYKGDLLDGFSLKEDPFEAWARAERERLRHLASDMLTKLIAHCDEVGDTERCVETAARLLTLDPLRESAHRIMMRAYAAQGHQTLALKQFETCRDILKRELGVEPEPETIALYREIHQQRAAAPDDKLSIAVLPFNNLSNNPEQDYLCDGIAEDIIANLCCYREIFVIDHHSTLEFRGVGTDTVLFAKELGVEYITKGSIRQSKDQIRISVQLIEAATGIAVWADRIDRRFDDLFAIEDEIAARIASSLVSHIEDESSARAMRKHPENMTAFDCVMRARRTARSYDRDKNASARRLLIKAIDLDPEYAAAYAYLSGSYCSEADTDWCEAREDTIEQAIAYAHKAVSLDDFDAGNHAAMGAAYMYQKKFELAEVHLDRAIECNPNSYGAFCAKCWVLTLSGRASEVMVCGNTALQLNPLAPDDCLLAIIIAHYLERKYDTALEMIARVRVPYAISEVCRALCLVQLGRDDEARNAAISAVEMGGNINEQGEYFRSWPFKNPNDLEHLMEGLHKSAVLLESSE